MIQKINTNEIESFIFWTLLRSYDILSCFYFKIGVNDLEKDEFFKMKFFTVIFASTKPRSNFQIIGLKKRMKTKRKKKKKRLKNKKKNKIVELKNKKK